MHSTNDATDLVQLQSDLDQLTVQQEAIMEEWAELSEQVELNGRFEAKFFVNFESVKITL